MKLKEIIRKIYPKIRDDAKIYGRVTILLLMTIASGKLRDSLKGKINLPNPKLA